MSKFDYTDRECSVYVGNLDKRVTEEVIWELFLQAGPLERVSIPKDKETGAQRSYGFVGFTSPASVVYASQLLNGVCLYGQNIIVKPQHNGSPAPNQGHRLSPLTSFNAEPPRHSPIPQYQAMPNDNNTAYMGNSQRQRQNSYGSNNGYPESPRPQHGGYKSPQFKNPPPSLMQQQYQARIDQDKNRRY